MHDDDDDDDVRRRFGVFVVVLLVRMVEDARFLGCFRDIFLLL